MLIAFFLGILAGVAVQLQQAVLWEGAGYVACGLMGLAGLVGCAVRGVRFEIRIGGLFAKTIAKIATFICAFILAFGLTGGRAVLYQQSAMNPNLEGKDIEVVGIVAAMPQRLETGLRFRFDVEAAHLTDKPVILPPRLLLSWYRRSFNDDVSAIATGARAFSLEDASITPQAGERWQFTVRLKAPHGNSNPHGFDYELWAWEQGAGGTGYVRESKRVNMTNAVPKKLGQASGNPFSNLSYSIERARQTTRDAVFKRLGGSDERASAGVIAALVTGDQNAIERSDWDIYRATGTAHLMSISGLHITMFAWLAALIIGRLWRTTARAQTAWIKRLCLVMPAAHAALVGGLLLAALYAWFSGWGVPAQRTVWMLATITMLRLTGLRWPWYVTWLLAAVVVLTVDPWAMLSAGFWLSFVAVAVLFASSPQQSTHESVNAPHARAEPTSALDLDQSNQALAPQQPERARMAVLLSACMRPLLMLLPVLREQWIITLALAPLTLLLFQQVSLIGLLANAVAIPVVTLVVTPLSMLGAFIHPLWDLAALCMGYLSVALKWLASVPYATVSMPAAPLWASALAVLGGVLLVIPLPLKQRLQAIACAALLIAPSLVWQPARPAQGQFEMLAIDIGQGNAVLVQTANHSLLFDAGPRFSRESDAGHRTIVPLLRALGTKLDVLMLSHRDSDHTGGAKAVLTMQPQARVMTSALSPKDRMDIGLVDSLPLEPCIAGQSWLWDGVRFEVLHPSRDKLDIAASSDRKTKPNSLSCVLKITNADQANPKSALLAADIEEPEERSLLGLQLESTVLLVPHHGSKTSSSEAFIDAVNPKIAIVQAGYRNRFAHPRPEVMARYEERKIQTVLSSQCGAARWRSGAPEAVVCQREIKKRYWMHSPSPLKGEGITSPDAS